jgi:hypothetical protein
MEYIVADHTREQKIITRTLKIAGLKLKLKAVQLVCF